MSKEELTTMQILSNAQNGLKYRQYQLSHCPDRLVEYHSVLYESALDSYKCLCTEIVDRLMVSLPEVLNTVKLNHRP